MCAGLAMSDCAKHKKLTASTNHTTPVCAGIFILLTVQNSKAYKPLRFADTTVRKFSIINETDFFAVCVYVATNSPSPREEILVQLSQLEEAVHALVGSGWQSDLHR